MAFPPMIFPNLIAFAMPDSEFEVLRLLRPLLLRAGCSALSI